MRAIKTTTISILAVGLLAGSAVGGAAQDEGLEGTASAFFSWAEGDPEGFEIITEAGFEEPMPGFVKLYGEVFAIAIEADDPRASGRLIVVGNWDDVLLNLGDDDEQVMSLSATSQQLVNEGGSWSGTGTSAAHAPQFSDDERTNVEIARLTGEGGYEGMTLILARSGGESWGWIVPASSVPPVPELPAD